jgi:hypothetical protein
VFEARVSSIAHRASSKSSQFLEYGTFTTLSQGWYTF